MKQGGRFVRLRERQIRLGEQKAQLAEAVRRRAELEQLLAVRDRVLMPALGDHCLELDQPGPGLVGAAALIRKEELDRLAEAARDVLEGRKGGTGATGLDQIDGGGGDTALANLREAESGLHAGLFDRPWPEIDSREAPVPSAAVGAVPLGNSSQAPAFAGINHARSLAQIT